MSGSGRKIIMKNLFKLLGVLSIVAIAMVIVVNAQDSSRRSLGSLLSGTGEVSVFNMALEAADLAELPDSDTNLTIFVPDDRAFRTLPVELQKSLFLPENKPFLQKILKQHFINQSLNSDIIENQSVVLSLAGEPLRFSRPESANAGSIRVNEATIVQPDLRASNGIIHIVDRVIMPEESVEPSNVCQEMITMAINRGVNHFNHGNHMACAHIYEMTAEGLMRMNDSIVTPGQKSMLSKALSKMRATHNPTTRAWVMRHALDDVLSSRILN